jgi:hypothetical protein
MSARWKKFVAVGPGISEVMVDPMDKAAVHSLALAL